MQARFLIIWLILILPGAISAQDPGDSTSRTADTILTGTDSALTAMPGAYQDTNNMIVSDSLTSALRDSGITILPDSITAETSGIAGLSDSTLMQEYDNNGDESANEQAGIIQESEPNTLTAIEPAVINRKVVPAEILASEEASTNAEFEQPVSDTLSSVADSLMALKSETGATKKSTLTKQGAGTMEQLKTAISFVKVIWSIIFLIAGYLFIRFTVKILNLFAERSGRVRLSFKRFIPIYRILAWTLVFFIIIQGIISPSWEAVVALGASVGVAVGFAAQDVLKNIFGGITILVEKPFQVGDKIEVGSHYGEVTHIGFRSSRIVTADDSAVTIPNAELTSKMVSNSNSGENNCQVVAEIFLPPDVDTSAVRQIALEAAQVSSLVYLKKPISVLFFHELKEDKTYLKMRLKAYVLDIRYEFAFKSEMTEIVLHELYKRGVISK